MIKLENVVLASPEQMSFIIQGLRNPFNSHNKSDSDICRRGTVDCRTGRGSLGFFFYLLYLNTRKTIVKDSPLMGKNKED